MYFDGVNDYTILNLPTNCMGNPDSCSQGLTICSWLYIITCTASNGNLIFGTVEASISRGIAFKCNGPTSDTLVYVIRLSFNDFILIGLPYSRNEWFHFCGIWNAASNELKAYVNGTQGGSVQTSAGNPDPSDGRMVLGGAYFDDLPSTRPSHMRIDELVVIEKPLDAASVFNMYKWYNT